MPDVCAVTSMYSNSLQAEHLVRAAKRRRPDLVTVAGGAAFRCPRVRLAAPPAGARLRHSGRRRAGASPSCSTRWRPAARGTTSPPSATASDGRDPHQPRAGPRWTSPTLPPMWSTLGDALDLRRYTAHHPAGNRAARHLYRGRPRMPLRLHFLRDGSVLEAAIPSQARTSGSWMRSATSRDALATTASCWCTTCSP